MIYKNQHPCILNSNLQDFILKKCTSQTKPPPPPQDMVVLRKPFEQKECPIGWVFDILKPPPPWGNCEAFDTAWTQSWTQVTRRIALVSRHIIWMLLKVSKSNQESKS